MIYDSREELYNIKLELASFVIGIKFELASFNVAFVSELHSTEYGVFRMKTGEGPY